MRTRRKMVTVVVYYVEGYYSCGWEAVTAEDSKTEAAQRLREYRDNDPQHAYRMVRRRECTTLTDLPTPRPKGQA